MPFAKLCHVGKTFASKMFPALISQFPARVEIQGKTVAWFGLLKVQVSGGFGAM